MKFSEKEINEMADTLFFEIATKVLETESWHGPDWEIGVIEPRKKWGNKHKKRGDAWWSGYYAFQLLKKHKWIKKTTIHTKDKPMVVWERNW